MDNPRDSEDDLAANDESEIDQNNGIEDAECPEQQDVSAAPDVPGLVRPTRKSKRPAEKALVTVNAIETRRNKGVKKKQHRMCQWFNSFLCSLTESFSSRYIMGEW